MPFGNGTVNVYPFTPVFADNNSYSAYNIAVGSNITFAVPAAVQSATTSSIYFEAVRDFSLSGDDRHKHRLNNSQLVKSAGVVQTTSSSVNLFGSYPGYFGDKNISEVIYYNRALNSTELSNIRTYINNKYGTNIS
jgi:hypothetical protein